MGKGNVYGRACNLKRTPGRPTESSTMGQGRAEKDFERKRRKVIKRTYGKNDPLYFGTAKEVKFYKLES